MREKRRQETALAELTRRLVEGEIAEDPVKIVAILLEIARDLPRGQTVDDWLHRLAADLAD